MNRTKLIQEVEKLRKRIYCTTKKNGNNLLNNETYRLSLELDKLIIQLMKYNS